MREDKMKKPIFLFSLVFLINISCGQRSVPATNSEIDPPPEQEPPALNKACDPFNKMQPAEIRLIAENIHDFSVGRCGHIAFRKAEGELTLVSPNFKDRQKVSAQGQGSFSAAGNEFIYNDKVGYLL